MKLPWSPVQPRLVGLLGLWLALFLLTATLLLGRVLLLQPDEPFSGRVKTAGENIFSGQSGLQTTTATPSPQGTAGRLTSVVLTMSAGGTLQAAVEDIISTLSGTPAIKEPGSAGTLVNTAVPGAFRTSTLLSTSSGLTSNETTTPTWYIRYYTPRPTVYVPARTPTRTFTPRPTRTPLPPTLLPSYRTATVAVARTGTATAQTATEAWRQTGTATIQTATAAENETATATALTATGVVLQTLTEEANRTATQAAYETATARAVATAQTATAVAQLPLAFSAPEPSADAYLDLQVVALDGSRREVIYRSPDSPGALVGDWSPDLGWLVFEGICGDPLKRTICRIHPDRSGLTLLPALPTGENTEPAWSPDGQYILFTNRTGGQTDLYLVRPDGTDLLKLTDAASNEWNPEWAPDSHSILFITDRDGNAEIYSMDLSAALPPTTPPAALPSPIRLTSTTDSESGPQYSANGQWVAFARQVGGQWDIYRSSPGAFDAAVPLTSDPANDRLPSWSPDSTILAFVSDRSGTTDELFTMSVDGLNPAAVPGTQLGTISRLRWIP